MTFLSNFRFIKQLYSYSKSRVIVTIISIFLDAIDNTVYSILFFPFIINAVNMGMDAKRFLIICGIFMGIKIITILFNIYKNNVVNPLSSIDISKGFQMQLLDKAANIDLDCYDNTEYYNQYVWTLNDCESRAIAALDTLSGWFNNLLMVISVISIILIYQPVILLASLIAIISSTLINKYINKLNFKYDQEKQKDQRKMGYAYRLFYLIDFSKEIKIYNIHVLLHKLFDTAINQLKSIILKYGKKIAIVSIINDILTMLFSIGVPMILIGYNIYQKGLPVGNMLIVSSAIIQLSVRLPVFTYIYTEMKKHSMYIENYNAFLAYQPKIEENAQGLTAKTGANDIELRGVNFGYSKGEEAALVLKDINMHIKAGEKIAIVGHNGAGKSTLIKLILRLYLPNDGEIFLDGEKADVYSLSSYRQRFGTIFQDFQLYAFNIGENVIMDNLNDSEEEKERIWNALENSGLAKKVKGYSKGLETTVTKEFEEDGVIFSGGEAQKLAIARILARDCGVVIMDEPSSNLDPISEYELYKNMMTAAKDKTVIIISHRLSATVDADRVYLMDNGKIVEQGTHQQLMKLNGKYAEMFTIQAGKYVDNIPG